MSQSFSNRLIIKLIDWLIALCGASLLLWFLVTQPVFFNVTSDADHIGDISVLKQHVKSLTIGFAPRTINYNNLNDTADYIFKEFSKVGIPEYQTISTLSKEYRNISLQLGPDTKELYVIGAHYDAKDDSIDTEGNASGVATLIELARHLAVNNNKLKIGVILIAYPLSLNQSDNIVNTGSYFHASSLKKINKSVRLMISLDGVGQTYVDNDHPFKFIEFLYPNTKDSLNLVGRFKDFKNIRELKKGFNGGSSLSLHSHTLLEIFNKTQSSDHVNYWNQDFPAVLISDVINKRQVPNMQNRIDPKDRLDYKKLSMLVNSLYQAVIQTKATGFDQTLIALHKKEKTKF